MQTISRQQKDFEAVRSVPDGKTTETRDTCGCIDAAVPLCLWSFVSSFLDIYIFLLILYSCLLWGGLVFMFK